ncbi:zinc ribbon domain-containing protein [Solimonas variicoloris]|uniref:zinc ribbon domain-containing protein n=1 Tax=Solimonas variicoloris TaxID=254408 RepID=UPI000A03AF18
MAPRPSTSPMLLPGSVRCGHCGTAMAQMTGKNSHYVYYACSSRRRSGDEAVSGQERAIAGHRDRRDRCPRPSRTGAGAYQGARIGVHGAGSGAVAPP